MHQVEGREWWLWGFAVAVTLVLTFGILSLTFPGFHLPVNGAYALNLKEWVRGLAALVLVFDIYTVYQQRYKGLILNDQYVGGNLGGEFSPGFLHQFLKCLPIDIEDRGGLVLGEGFERHQQKRLPRHSSDLSETAVRRRPVDDLLGRATQPG